MVDYARRCYRSKWRLFKDNPRLREGFYYFAKKGTPVYPGLHNLWSRDWVTDGYQFGDPPLGEWGGERTFYKGYPPAEVPLPRLVGTKDCVERGNEYSEPHEPANGPNACRLLPDACYPTIDEVDLRTIYNDCRWAIASATILNQVYLNLAVAEQIARIWFGDNAEYFQFPQLGALLPAMLAIRKQGRVFVIITGTTNAQQLALQAFGFGIGPVNVGQFSVPLFQHGATISTLQRLRDVLDPWPMRLQFIGHSYGGTISVIAAMMSLVADRTRHIELLTFGAPRATDERGIEIIANVQQCHWRNEDDPIPALPPDRFQQGELFLVIPIDLFLRWEGFAGYDGVRMLLDAGGVAEVQSTENTQELAATVALLIAAAEDVPFFASHQPMSYVNKIAALCPCAPFQPPGNFWTKARVTIEGLKFTDTLHGTEATLDWCWIALRGLSFPPYYDPNPALGVTDSEFTDEYNVIFDGRVVEWDIVSAKVPLKLTFRDPNGPGYFYFETEATWLWAIDGSLTFPPATVKYGPLGPVVGTAEIQGSIKVEIIWNVPIPFDPPLGPCPPAPVAFIQNCC